jgi:signal transduction histidine kinase
MNHLNRLSQIVPPPGTMRRRITFYLLFTIVPLVFGAAYMALDQRDEEEAAARARDQAIVGTVRTDLDRLFQMIRSYASSLGYVRNDDEACNSLTPLRRSFPGISNLGLFEVRDGGTTARGICLLRPPKLNPFPISPEESIQLPRIGKPGEIAVLPIRRGAADGGPVIPVVSLIRNMGKGRRIYGVASLDLKWLSAEMNRVAIPPQSILLILDRQGLIAARNPVSDTYAVGKPAPEFERTLPNRGDFAREIVGEGGISRFYVLARVTAADGLVVVLKTRASEIFRHSRQGLLVRLAALFIVTLLIFAFALSNTNRHVVRPLARLAREADRLATGNLAARSGLEYHGEIGQLARSFDAMAVSLQQNEIHTAALVESLRALSTRLESVREEERTRISRQIHDELGQQLTVVKFSLHRLARRAANSAAARSVSELGDMVDSAIAQVRRIASDLRPAALDYGGLADAIEGLARNFERSTDVRCTVEAQDEIDIPADLATCLYRICQESLTNIARHARASEALIQLRTDGESLTLSVIDNGRGMVPVPEDNRRSLGILGMGERTRIVGGHFDILSTPAHGTVVTACIPLKHSRAADGKPPRADIPTPARLAG